MAFVTREEFVRELQITALLNKVEITVEETRSECAALSRAAAETVQKFQDNLEKQHAEFEVKIGVTHSDFVKSHAIHSVNMAKVVRDVQDAFDKARVRLEETVTTVKRWTQMAEDFGPEEHGGDRQGGGEGCGVGSCRRRWRSRRLVQEVAFPDKSMVPETFGGKAEDWRSWQEEIVKYTDSRAPGLNRLLKDASRTQKEITGTWRAARDAQFGDLVEDHIRVHRALEKLTTSEARKVVGAVRDEDGFRMRFKPTLTGHHLGGVQRDGWSVSRRPLQASW